MTDAARRASAPRRPGSAAARPHPPASHPPTAQALYSKARVLDVLQDDLDERCKDVEGRAVALDAATMRRLHRASLPPDDSLRASELLGKLAALDRARAEARAVRRLPCG